MSCSMLLIVDIFCKLLNKQIIKQHVYNKNFFKKMILWFKNQIIILNTRQVKYFKNMCTRV